MKMPEIDYPAFTALVTGGTSGIGRAIAFELASRKTGQIVIVAQDATELSKTAAEIEASTPGVVVRTVEADLSTEEGFDIVERKIAEWGWNIDILVNNAGLARKEVFAEDPQTDHALIIVDLMVRAVVDASLRFLPGMAERGRGGILNIASTAGYQSVPFTAAYAASKAFLISFSQAIREERLNDGVRVACIVPGVTDTDLDGDGHGERRGVLDKVGIHDPEEVAKAAVDAFEDNAAEKVLGMNNKIQSTLFAALPKSLAAKLISASRGGADGS